MSGAENTTSIPRARWQQKGYLNERAAQLLGEFRAWKPLTREEVEHDRAHLLLKLKEQNRARQLDQLLLVAVMLGIIVTVLFSDTARMVTICAVTGCTSVLFMVFAGDWFKTKSNCDLIKSLPDHPGYLDDPSELDILDIQVACRRHPEIAQTVRRWLDNGGMLTSAEVEFVRDVAAAMEVAQMAEAGAPLVIDQHQLLSHLSQPRDLDADQFEVRADGNRVRKDRWETGIRSIASILTGPRVAFEIPDVVERVRELARQARVGQFATETEEEAQGTP